MLELSSTDSDHFTPGPPVERWAGSGIGAYFERAIREQGPKCLTASGVDADVHEEDPARCLAVDLNLPHLSTSRAFLTVGLLGYTVASAGREPH